MPEPESNLPVTGEDKQWIEESLLWIAKTFGEDFLKTVSIKSPTTRYFNRKFSGSEEDVSFALDRICEYMSVDRNTVHLVFYGQEKITSQWRIPTGFSSTKGSAGTYMALPEGHSQISLNISELNNPISFISTLAHEVAHVKLLGEKKISENNEPLTDLTAIAFGFGIFTGNSIFQMKQWQDSNLQGWSMNKKGYLPEQMVAYALAWMVAYREEEDLSWSKYLNSTMLKHFEKSLDYIRENPERICFSIPEENPESEDILEPLNETLNTDSRSIIYLDYSLAGIEETDENVIPNLKGSWSGEIIYGPTYGKYAGQKLTFEASITLFEEDEFQGTARDLEGLGKDTGTEPASVQGFTEGNRISFVKTYHGPRAREIHYNGLYNPENGEFRGAWNVESTTSKKEGSGFWKMRKGD